MTAVLFVTVAAAATIARAVVTFGQQPPAFPWRTFTVNVLGALALGTMVGAGWHDSVILTAGALGSLTTFSTVAAEAASLVDDGRSRRAMAYVGLTIAVGIAAAWLGINLGEQR